ncbi:Penicillin-binding protein 2 [uncultured Clostridium sp.]|uniref:penicillin-binding transpeptidase domain-containing protein n=1 Tax=uncultured Clostridium sp. TaxID=59620 RepID=UPI000822EDBC|nr:penicillin-binding transpeptidase domain-containing protein [uncultured Clostridium sp.]SCJ62837.1 Penicillin-binding protein 2 [uncultured Clostridium sp.]
MKKVHNKVIILMFIMIVSLFGCSKVNKYSEAFEVYKDKWIQGNFAEMYQLLTTDSKSYIDEATFVERYTNIYSAIEMANIQIEINGELIENDEYTTIPFSLKAKTVAGDIALDNYKVDVYKEDKEYKIKWDESLIFPEMISGDKLMVESYPSKRGSILDRNGVVLAENGTISVVGIHPAIFDLENRDEKLKEIAIVLDMDLDTIIEKLNRNTNPEHFVPIVDILSNDEKLASLYNRESEGIVISTKESRVYHGGKATGRLIGYIGNITSEELTNNVDKGYNELSLIGKAGIEQVYEEKLRGFDGSEIYIDRNGEYITIAKKEPINGSDIKLSIDLALQNKAYEELNGEKGAVTAVDPKTGEVLALVSAPSYDSNTFVTYITKSQTQEWKNTNNADQINRFSNVYSPGSTMKLITAAIGLNNGVLNADEVFNINGEAWQKDESWGTYNVTRVPPYNESVTLREAAKFSDNIYFAQVALKLGKEKLIEGIKGFGIGEEIKFDYPIANSSISNSGDIDNDILLADTGYGQGELMVTPLNMALVYSALANEGNIMEPRLVINDGREVAIWKENAIKKENVPILVDDFSALINDEDGTAIAARIPGVNIAGKTGTAEIKSSQDDTEGTENGWFIGVDTTGSKISVAMIIEDVKGRGGSQIPVPKVKNIIEEYIK